MKKSFYVLLGILVTLCIVACNNSLEDSVAPNTPQEEQFSFTVNFEESTRIALGSVRVDENGDKTVGFLFEPYDRLIVHLGGSNLDVGPLYRYDFINDEENLNTFTIQWSEDEFNANYSKADRMYVMNKRNEQRLCGAWETFNEAAAFEGGCDVSCNNNPNITLSLKNSVFICEIGADPVKFYIDNECIDIPANCTRYISSAGYDCDISYSINGVIMKEAHGLENGKVYNLGQLVSTAVAKVGEVGYRTIEDAIDKANGDVITLLTDVEVSQACVINANGHKLQTTGGVMALKNYKNDNGYYDVVAVTESPTWHMVGNHISNQWQVATRNTPVYQIDGTHWLVVGNIELKGNTQFKFVNGSSWSAQQVGSPLADNNKDVNNTWFHAGTNNINVSADGVYNLYYDLSNNVFMVADVEDKMPELTFTTYYLYTGGSNLWNRDGAWFVAHLWTGSAARDYKMVASIKKEICLK